MDNRLKSDIFLAFVADKDTLEVVKSLSLSRYGLNVEGQQGNVKSAIEYLKVNTSPRILLIDLSGSDFPLTDMQAVADVCEPGVQVIAIGVANDVGLFRDLVHLGVKDYIAKPLNVRLLVQSIETLMGMGGPKKRDSKFTLAGKLISFLGARGGVGSSTLAANFSWVLANNNCKKLCIADLDFKTGIIHQLYNHENHSPFADVLNVPERIDESVIMQSVRKMGDYLSMLGTPIQLDDDFPFPTQAMEACLPILLHHFHYTVLDLPRYDHRVHYPIVGRSDVIVVTCDMTLLSIREVVSLLRILKSTQDMQLLIVANKADMYKKGQLDRHIFEESIGQEIDLVIPFDSSRPLQCLNEGVLAASEKGILLNAVNDLISIISGRKVQPTTESSSFFGGLFGGKKSAND